MSFFVVLPIPFDVLDAAIAEKITHFTDGVVEHVRLSITDNSSRYCLNQEQLGDIGELRIRKLVDGQSELYVKNPRRPGQREFTDEEKALKKSKTSVDERNRYISEVNKQIRKETDELHDKRANHLREVVDGLLQKLGSDPFTWPPSTRVGTIDEILDAFAKHISTDIRMSFWTSDMGNHKWISRPEYHAQRLLFTFLRAKLDSSALIFEELDTGAGRLDLLVAFSVSEKYIIELKMCGAPYSLKYAKKGFGQIQHYMENRDVKLGYLLIFDARKRDFNKNIPADEIATDYRIEVKVIDVRPNVV